MNQKIRLLATAGLLVGLLGCSKKEEVTPIARVASQNNVPATQPCGAAIGVECPGGNVQYLPNFFSTEGTVGYDNLTSNSSGAYNGPGNPNGDILDVRLIYDNDETPNGYVRMGLDLNRGTGGTPIHFCFTRNPQYLVQSSVSGPVTGLEPATDPSNSNYPALATNEDYLRADYCPPLSSCGWQVGDLNRGTWSLTIRTIVKRNSSNRPIEIGFIHSQDGSVGAPAGWTKIPFDLNKGVGGNCPFIYFCYKQR